MHVYVSFFTKAHIWWCCVSCVRLCSHPPGNAAKRSGDSGAGSLRRASIDHHSLTLGRISKTVKFSGMRQSRHGDLQHDCLGKSLRLLPCLNEFHFAWMELPLSPPRLVLLSAPQRAFARPRSRCRRRARPSEPGFNHKGAPLVASGCGASHPNLQRAGCRVRVQLGWSPAPIECAVRLIQSGIVGAFLLDL